jgi:hypothetical protein
MIYEKLRFPNERENSNQQISVLILFIRGLIFVFEFSPRLVFLIAPSLGSALLGEKKEGGESFDTRSIHRPFLRHCRKTQNQSMTKLK